jgi:hypothetical protein
MFLRSHAKSKIYTQDGWVKLPVDVNKQLADWRKQAMSSGRSKTTRFNDQQTKLNGEMIAYDVQVNADGAVLFERIYGCETKFFFDPRWDEIMPMEIGVSGFYPAGYSI